MDLNTIGMRISTFPGKFRLGIEEIHLAGTTILDYLNDDAGLIWKVTLPRFQTHVGCLWYCSRFQEAIGGK